MRIPDFGAMQDSMCMPEVEGRVNQQVQYYKKNLKNSSLGEEMFNFSLGRRFILFCPDLLRPEAATLPVPFHQARHTFGTMMTVEADLFTPCKLM